MKYSCSDCGLKACCLQPVELVKEDINRFRDNNIDVPLVYSNIGDMFVLIDSFKDGKVICPMMDNDGLCTIYEHRPNICRTFNCKALDMDKHKVDDFTKTCSESEYIDLLQSPGENSKKELLNDIRLKDIKDFKHREILPLEIMKCTVNNRYSLLVFLGASEDEAMKQIKGGGDD